MSWKISVGLTLGALELDVSIAGEAGVVAIVGPNGAGKTTLLRSIAGALQPATGRITVGEAVLFDAERDLCAPPEDRRMGYVPQGYGLFPHLNAVDNVAFGLLQARPEATKEARRQAALEMLDGMGCTGLALRLPEALSAGEKQKVALARALIVEPSMLLLDEPLSALDAVARRAMRGFLAQQLAARDTPAIVITHDLRDISALGATVVVMENGKVIQQGAAEELAANPATPFVAEFFHADLN
jgi:ABC-type sulfate/molybdate transport systems ATPase subunit